MDQFTKSSSLQVAVWKNIELLIDLLGHKAVFRGGQISSVLADGSLVRGDFVDDASDIDLTITTFTSSLRNSELRAQILNAISIAERKLPKRAYPRKRLRYDIQWQDILTVRQTGQRGIADWSLTNIPEGYPALWLYAFDGIANHEVLVGEDITKYYTRIPPEQFVPLRLERIRRSTENLGTRMSQYEFDHGAITQMKNAWEAVRAVCLWTGLRSLNKDDVYARARAVFSADVDADILDRMWSFYKNSSIPDDLEAFRMDLSDFTIRIAKRFATRGDENRMVPSP